MTIVRENWIDSCKGYAIILVVVGHLLQGLYKAGIFANQALFHYLDFTIYSFHMPLFFLLSGYVYRKFEDRITLNNYKAFLKKKLFNLSIPFLTFTMVQQILNMMLSGYVNSPLNPGQILFSLFIRPIAPFWFLYTLFFIYALIPLLEWTIKNKIKLTAVLAALTMVSLAFKTHLFLVDSLCQFLFYFYLGSLWDNGKPLLTTGSKILCYKRSSLTLAIIYGLLNPIYYFFLVKMDIWAINGICRIGMALSASWASMLLIRQLSSRETNFTGLLNRIGSFSFHVFLLHTIFSAGMRIILRQVFHCNHVLIHFGFGFLAGMVGPIIIGYFARFHKWLNFFFTPKKTVTGKRG